MKRKKRTSILILLVLVCLALLGTGTYAAYTNVKSIKRVVATKSSSDELRFSSNYLLPYDSGETVFSTKLISAGQADEVSIGLTVCNYPQNDITKYSNSNISYSLYVQVFDSQSSAVADPTILNKILINGAGLSSPYSSTLAGGQQSTDVYHITFNDVNALSQYTIQIRAVPTGIGKILAANLKIVAVSAQSTEWKGQFLDQSVAPTNLDAFNYEISGSAQQSVTLWWDTKHVKLSQWSREELASYITGSTGDSITFSVGEDGQPGSYRLQFYRTSPIPTGETWGTVENYVRFPGG